MRDEGGGGRGYVMIISINRFFHQWLVQLDSIDDNILIVLFNDIDLSWNISLNKNMTRDRNVIGLQHLTEEVKG
jgi:hypothetical protein